MGTKWETNYNKIMYNIFHLRNRENMEDHKITKAILLMDTYLIVAFFIGIFKKRCFSKNNNKKNIDLLKGLGKKALILFNVWFSSILVLSLNLEKYH